MFWFQFSFAQFPDGADALVSVQFHSAALLSLSKMDDTIENGYRLMSWVSLKGGVIEVDQYDDYRKSLDPWWFVWIYQWWSPWSIYRYFAWAHFFAMITLIISHHIPPQHVIPVIMMASNGSSRLGNTQDIMTIYWIKFSLLSKPVCVQNISQSSYKCEECVRLYLCARVSQSIFCSRPTYGNLLMNCGNVQRVGEDVDESGAGGDKLDTF